MAKDDGKANHKSNQNGISKNSYLQQQSHNQQSLTPQMTRKNFFGQVPQNENSQYSDGAAHDNSSFQLGAQGMGLPDESQFGVGGGLAQIAFDQKHQDATLNRNHWVPDQKARQCFKCYKDFTFFYRKHHCRICGNVFCHNCTTVQAIKSGGIQQKNVRMCAGCEDMIKKYQTELQNKNNLIQTHQRGSNYFKDHQFNSSGNNLRGSDEFQIDGLDQNSKGPLSAKDLEELKRLRQIKDEIDDIDQEQKRDGVNRLLRALEEEKYEFTGSVQIDHNNMDKLNFQRLKDFSNFHIRNIVFDTMNKNGLSHEKWGSRLLDYVSTAVESVKPSSRLLGDEMNFNKYIKIKIINHVDNSRSAYVKGVVLSKNLADKRIMQQKERENPKILLLKDSLGGQSANNGNESNMLISDISTVIDQEQYQVKIINEKLRQVQPDILIVEKDVSFQVLEQLSNVDIVVISNLDLKKMKRIARYTQTIISPSYNVIDQNFVLGRCSNFKVEKPYIANLPNQRALKGFGGAIANHNMLAGLQPAEDVSQSVLEKNAKLISNERTLLFFEGCNPTLGCTILLSGNIQTEIEELKKVKLALKDMLSLARNVVLERSFLMDLNATIPRSSLDDGSINAAESPFLITHNVENRQTLVLSKVVMKKAEKQQLPGTAAQTQNINNVNQSQQINAQQLQTMMQQDQNDQANISQLLSPQATLPQQQQVLNYQQATEEKVKQFTDKVCGCPKKEKWKFYEKDENSRSGKGVLGKSGDMTIGSFLRDLIKTGERPCEYCKEPQVKHFTQYYHKDGCIEVQINMIQKNETKNKTQTIKPKQQKPKKKSETKMFGFCNICNKTVTPEVALRDSFYEYSTARFLEQFFYNGDKLFNLPRNNVNCSHKSLREISRVFQYSKGVQITFRFIPLDVYTIEMIQPKTQDTKETLHLEIDRRKRNIELGIHVGNEQLKNRISTILDFIKQEKRLILSKEAEKALSSNTNIPLFVEFLKVIKMRLKELEKEISNFIQIVTLPLHEVDSIFGTLFLERKVLVNLLTFQKLMDEISRIACLVLVILSLRMNILKQSPHQLTSPDERLDQSQTNAAIYDNPADSSSSKIDQHALGAGSSGGIGSGGMGNPNFVDRNTHVHAQNLNSVERQTLSNLKNFKVPSTSIKQADFDKLISELFAANTQDFNQTFTMNQTQMNIAPSKQLGTLNQNTAANIEPIKQIIRDRVQTKLDALTDEYISNIKQARALDIMKSASGSQSEKIDFDSWLKLLSDGFVGLPLGTDNLYVPVKEKDIGSIISFVLASNIYKEAMIKQNYMDISQKIKGLRQHPRGQNQFPGTTSNADAQQIAMGIRDSNVHLGGFAAQAQYQTKNTYIGAHQSDEAIKLLGKNDVFNAELSAHQIETELLCGERLQFIVKFATDKEDLSIKMIKNGNSAKLKQTSLQFITGVQVSTKNKTKKISLNDYQGKICPSLSRDYLDSDFYSKTCTELDQVLKLLNVYYFEQPQSNPLAQNPTFSAQAILSPPRTLVAANSQVMSNEDSQNLELLNQDQQHHFNHLIDQSHPTVPSMRESLSAAHLNFKSPTMGNSTQNVTMNIPQTSGTPQLGNTTTYNINLAPGANTANFSNSEPQEFCGIKSPKETLIINPNYLLRQELQLPKVDYQLKIYFPKKFEALRRFYCGSQYDFIQSLLKTIEWSNVSGGKSKSKFYKSYDDKYVYKELKKNEFKMFLDFAPQYFDYLCKSFFHNYPCALCKILGAYKIKITSKQNGQSKAIKKYLFITENLNFGIKPEDESHIVRYDLKGSKLNRFVQSQEKTVLHDNNFLLQFNGRPLPIRYTINRILHICINNDTLCLSKSNIIDYSLLTIVDKKYKKVRFGIIDYVQQYTLEKIFESKFKNLVKGQEPTIVDPDKYKQRFKQAMKSYFVGMCIQEEKEAAIVSGNVTDKQGVGTVSTTNRVAGGTTHGVEEGDSDSDDEINETVNMTYSNLVTPAMTGKHTREDLLLSNAIGTEKIENMMDQL